MGLPRNDYLISYYSDDETPSEDEEIFIPDGSIEDDAEDVETPEDVEDESTDPIPETAEPVVYDDVEPEAEGTEGDEGEALEEDDDSTEPTELPELVYTQVTVKQRSAIEDFRPSQLQELANAGVKFYVLYTDGTEDEVTWDEVYDPHVVTSKELMLEADAIGAASNQHFWDDDNGAHVTDDEWDNWDTEYDKPNHGSLSAPTSSKPWHNILLNSLGVLLRTGLLNLVAISKNGITFYDGNANTTEDIIGFFGSTRVQIGRDNTKHLVMDANGITVYNGDGTIAPLNAANINAIRATIDELIAGSVTTQTLRAASAYIAALSAANVSANDISADKATINSLVSGSVTTDTLRAASAYIAALNAANVSASDISADKATIGSLISGDVTTTTLRAASAYIAALSSASISANDISADHATIGSLNTNFASVNLANVNNAWIENGTVKDGAITNAMINSVSANKLTAGTIDASNITVTNLNADNITTGTINGQRIGTGSLSLDKLADDVYTESEVDNIVDGLNARIDAQIETWTTDTVPTLNNAPASSWTSNDLKSEHVGDICYVVNANSQADGYTYRFAYDISTQTYAWVLIKDNQVTAALQRLLDAEGDISDLQSFQSTTSSWITQTNGTLSSVQSNYTSLSSQIAGKVDTSTFNTLSQTVNSNSSSITSLSTILTNNGLTNSTDISNTVNTISQTSTSNSSTISNLTTLLGTNSDGTTHTNDVIHRTTSLEQDLNGFKTTVSSTYATNSRVSLAESSIQQNATNIALKVSNDSVISAINQSAENITISASKVNIAGDVLFTSGRLSSSSLDNAYDSKGSAAVAATTATEYITAINSNGIKVHASNNAASNYSKIDSTGLEVVSSGNSIASFGEESRIGLTNGKHIAMSSVGIAIKNGNNIKALYGDNVKIGGVYRNYVSIEQDKFKLIGGGKTLFSVSKHSPYEGQLNEGEEVVGVQLVTVVVTRASSGSAGEWVVDLTQYGGANKVTIEDPSSEHYTIDYVNNLAIFDENTYDASISYEPEDDGIAYNTHMNVYDGKGSSDTNRIVHIESNLARIGHENGTHIDINDEGLYVASGTGHKDIILSTNTRQIFHVSNECHEITSLPTRISINPMCGDKIKVAFHKNRTLVAQTEILLTNEDFESEYEDFSSEDLIYDDSIPGYVDAESSLGYIYASNDAYNDRYFLRNNEYTQELVSNGYRYLCLEYYMVSDPKEVFSIGSPSYEYEFGTKIALVGTGITSSSDNSLVIGRWNDTYTYDRAFTIGNGTADDSRSDAFSVDWNGRVQLGPQELNDTNSGIVIYGSNVGSSSSSAPASSLYGNLISGYDSLNHKRTYFRHVDGANGRQGLQIETRRLINSSWVYNSLNLWVDQNGNRAVTVAEAAPWKEALGLGSINITSGVYIAQTVDTSNARWRIHLTNLGNLRIDKSEDSGRTWNIAGYCVKSDQAGYVTKNRGGTGVTSTSSSTLSIDTSNATVGSDNYCWHNGIVATVVFNFTLKANLANNSTRTVATVPSGYRPSHNFSATCYTSPSTDVQAIIQSGGAVVLRNASGAALTSATTIRISATYALSI